VSATTAALGYAAAVQASADAIGNLWKARTAVDFNQHSALTAEIQLDSLAEWGRIQEKLVNVPVVTNVNVEAMSIGHARIVISYAGTLAQLGDFLSQASLGLTSRDGVWWLNAQTR
jgi:energy-converting hydrogenase Eha subunit E